MKNAIVLCSGGLDSVVTAYYVRKKRNYDSMIILFINYSQRNYCAERKFSKRNASDLNARFIEIRLNEIYKLSNSLLNSNKRAIKLKRKDLKNTKNESKKWYVPCRNLVFISYALALAELIFLRDKIKSDIFLGFKNEGNEYYPDTTADFLNSLNKVSNISTAGKYKILAPLIKKDKEEIILLGVKLGIDFKKTFSCYTNEKVHCGTCLACKLRQEGFYWANVADPTEYLKEED